MGQQPNIELEISDLPRPRRKPDPARSWIPDRPGDLNGPTDMKWGAGFGTIGPDAGYARSLAAAREIELADGEHRANADVAVAAVAAARASLFRRGPTAHDVDLALVLLGYDPTGVPDDVVSDLSASRPAWFAAVAHHPDNLAGFLARIEPAVLRLSADQARSRMAQGERLIAR